MKDAAEIAQLAREAGHEVSIIERPPPPDFADGFTKSWPVCTCGWEGRKRRAKKIATMDGIRHMISASADEDLRRERLNGGTARRGA